MERKKAEKEFKQFFRAHLLPPEHCKKASEIVYCIELLRHKMLDLKYRSNYVPMQAHQLLHAYATRQERLSYREYQQTYG